MRCAPTGEGRTPHFHVRPGRKRNWSSASRDRPALLSQGEAEKLGLFGPEPLSALARRRFGDYVGITLAPSNPAYYESADSTSLRHIGVHGGMCPAEVRIPLAIR